VGKKFRRAALVGLDVRDLVTKNAVIGLAGRGERERVGSGAVEDEEDLTMRLEDLADQVGGAGGPGIVAVTDRMALIGFRQRCPGFGTDAGVIVAGKMAADSGVAFHIDLMFRQDLAGKNDEASTSARVCGQTLS